jgi:hypothetical protein
MEWIPHYSLEHQFSEPSFWRMASIDQCRQALSTLGQVFGGEVTWDDFYSRFPLANSNPSKAMLPDAEGFVTYVRMQAFGKEQFVYCKAKTWMYYILHKIRARDVASVLLMPKSFGDHFPGYHLVHAFFGAEGQAKIHQLVVELCSFVTSDEVLASLDEKARNSLLRRLQEEPDVCFKIALNNAKGLWDERSCEIAFKYFPTLRGYTEQALVSTTLRRLIMDLQCFYPVDVWERNLQESLSIEVIARERKISDSLAGLWDLMNSAH